MARKTSQESESREVMDVDWDTVAEPLDITVTRNGTKVPRRKVRVRGIVGDDWLEQEAMLDRGAIRRLVAAIQKLARHGYEARLAKSIRFVHMYDNKEGLYLSPQLLKPFKDEVLGRRGARQTEDLGAGRRQAGCWIEEWEKRGTRPPRPQLRDQEERPRLGKSRHRTGSKR